MAQTARRARTKPSSTTQKSSEKQTEKPQSDSQASEKASDETSTQETTSSSSSSSDDENDALFEEADAKAEQGAQGAQDDDEEGEDDQEAQEAAQDAEDLPEGDLVTFTVTTYEPNYEFQAAIRGNFIVVAKDATREFTLPGTSRTGTVLAHHKGQVLPLDPWRKFAKGLDKE